MTHKITNAILEHQDVVKNTFTDDFNNNIHSAANEIATIFKNGGKILFFGNGGSAADAQHISAEFVSKLECDRLALPALALTVDSSALTAIGNDYGFQHLFSRQIEAVADQHDIVVGITTSGRSENVLRGIKTAKDKGCKTVALTGEKGLANIDVDYLFSVKSTKTARIQETHILIGHLLCLLTEDNYFAS